MKQALAEVLRRLWPGRYVTDLSTQSAASETTKASESAGESAALAPLAEECRRLQALIEAADGGLVACDAAGRLNLVNPAAADLLRIEPLRSGCLVDWPTNAAALRTILERAMTEGPVSVELDLDRDGRRLGLLCRAHAIQTESGHVDGALVVLSDLARSRETTATRVEDWEALAHDLQTPLNSIGGFTSLLLQEAVGPLNPLQRDFLQTIEQEGHRLLGAVQGFLEEAREGEIDRRLDLQAVRIRPLVDETVERLRALAARKSLQVDIRVPDDLPAVEADSEKIGLVLMNLLDNAIGFSRHASRILVAASERRECVEISVEDEGAGIPEESLDSVFSRFYRGPNQPSGRRGVGLGLAICKQFVESHRGRIWAEPRPGGGSRLAFTLPRAATAAVLEAAATTG